MTSTKLPGNNRVTSPLVTPLVDNGESVEEALTRIGRSMGEQTEQMSIKMRKLEKAAHVERKVGGKRSTATDEKAAEAKKMLERKDG